MHNGAMAEITILRTDITALDVDAVVMYPQIADSLTAVPLTPVGDDIRIGEPTPFLTAAADALGIERMRVIDTGEDHRQV